MLQSYQEKIEINKLYRVRYMPGSVDQLEPNIYVKGGNVNLYSYNGDTTPSSFAEMSTPPDDQDFTDYRSLKILPTYIAFEEVSGTITELILSNIKIDKVIGSIS